MKTNLRHVDAFSGATFALVQVNAPTANDADGSPFDDGIRTERTRARARNGALATLDVLTPANWAAYAALMSA